MAPTRSCLKSKSTIGRNLIREKKRFLLKLIDQVVLCDDDVAEGIEKQKHAIPFRL